MVSRFPYSSGMAGEAGGKGAEVLVQIEGTNVGRGDSGMGGPHVYWPCKDIYTMSVRASSFK